MGSTSRCRPGRSSASSGVRAGRSVDLQASTSGRRRAARIARRLRAERRARLLLGRTERRRHGVDRHIHPARRQHPADLHQGRQVNCFSHGVKAAVGLCSLCQKGVCRECVGHGHPEARLRRLPANGGNLPGTGGDGTAYGFEYKSATIIAGWPLVHVCSGFDPVTMRPRIARGIVAIGNIAVGGLAIGGVAFGLVAIGGRVDRPAGRRRRACRGIRCLGRRAGHRVDRGGRGGDWLFVRDRRPRLIES